MGEPVPVTRYDQLDDRRGVTNSTGGAGGLGGGGVGAPPGPPPAVSDAALFIFADAVLKVSPSSALILLTNLSRCHT